jgi:leucyl/phenylalanyl-tRNA--protein transferase
MTVIQFPDPRSASPEGIVALGGDLEPASLQLAYSQGIFPWPISGLPLAWFCPAERAILEWSSLHIPRSLARKRKKSEFRFTINQAFDAVIAHCARVKRSGQKGTWMTQELLSAYRLFHRLGHAHSVEVWRDEMLIGGLYGVDTQGVFSGESMFHLESDTSKLAILFLMEHLHSRHSDWMDIQVMTPHMQRLGAREISRDEFLEKLASTMGKPLQLFSCRK